MSGLDRRDFVKKAGLGAAGAGALWVAPSVIGYNAAFAGASCLQKDTLDWDNQTAGTRRRHLCPTPRVGSYPAVTVIATRSRRRPAHPRRQQHDQQQRQRPFPAGSRATLPGVDMT